MFSGKKLVKTEKSKFRKNSEFDEQQKNQQKKKHHDKALYRQMREEDEYEHFIKS